jgi:PAS domain S-box-containing protein
MVTGYSKDEAMGKDLIELIISKEHKDDAAEIFEKTKGGTPIYNVEKHITTKNGEERQILWSGAPIENEDNKRIGEIYIGNDITEKSIMVNEVIRQNKELTAINSVGLSLSRASDLDATLENALSRALELIAPAGGAIYLLNETGNMLEMKASYGLKTETEKEFNTFDKGKGIIGKVLGAKHHVFLKNLLLFSDRSKQVLEREGFKSMAFIPLRTRRGTIGVFAVGVMDPFKLTPENIKVFITISNQIGIIVDNSWLFQELSMVSREWENTFNTISDPMILISKENKILWVNIAYARMMTSIPEDLIGKGCCDIFHNENSPIHSCIHKQVFETKVGFSEEVYDPNTGMTIHVTCSPYNNSRGELVGTLIIAKDITEKKEVENEIKYLKEFNENIIDSLGDGLEIIGPDHKIQYMSTNFHKSMGKDVIGKTCYEVHFESETTLECQTPQGKSILVTHSPLKNQDGSYSAILLFKPQSKEPSLENERTNIGDIKEDFQISEGQDITDLGFIVSGIQHEMNNPLGGILGNAQALSDEEDPLKIRLFAAEIQNSAKRVCNLINSISRNTKIQPGSVLEKIDLNEVIINSLNTLNQDEKFENVEVETDLQPIPKIDGDPVDILNVFINLISNSLESMEGPGKIHISTRIQNGDIQMVFKDTGCEIPKEHHDKIFDPFYGMSKESPGHGTSNNGTGRRMFAVSNILKKYNAPISIENEIGQGTSFIVNFPYKKKPEPEENT